jgi:hypothetical protein
MAIEPSPTAEATRSFEPRRTSPTARTPGTLVSSGSGGRPEVRRAARYPAPRVPAATASSPSTTACTVKETGS